MMTVNPYATLAESIPSAVIQGFVLVMLALIFFGTVIQMIHHKNITYFFNNAKKAKLSAERELSTGDKAAIIAKTVVMILQQQLNLDWQKKSCPCIGM